MAALFRIERLSHTSFLRTHANKTHTAPITLHSADDLAVDMPSTSESDDNEKQAAAAATDAKAAIADGAAADPGLLGKLRGSRAWQLATAGVNYDVHKVRTLCAVCCARLLLF